MKTKTSDIKNRRLPLVFYERMMISAAFLVLLLGSAFSIYNSHINKDAYLKTIIPFAYIIIPAVNCICASLCFFLIFFPRYNKLQILITAIQSIMTTLSVDYQIFGLILFFLAFVLAYFHGYLYRKRNLKIIVIFLIWNIILLGIIPVSIQKYLFVLCITWFVCTIFFFVLNNVEILFNERIKILEQQAKKSLDKIVSQGNKIELKNLNLTDRQKIILVAVVRDNKLYKEISLDLNISESVVKHEMRIIKDAFGVSSSNELIQILDDYELI